MRNIEGIGVHMLNAVYIFATLIIFTSISYGGVPCYPRPNDPSPRLEKRGFRAPGLSHPRFDYLCFATYDVTRELHVEEYTSARNLFSKIYLNPYEYTTKNDLYTPIEELEFQALLMSDIWWSIYWYEMDNDLRTEFLTIALKQKYSFPQYRWDIINRLRHIGTIEAMAAIFRESQTPPKYIDDLSRPLLRTALYPKNSTEPLPPEPPNKSGYPQSVDMVFSRYKSTNHDGFIKYIINLYKGRFSKDTPPSKPELIKMVMQWVEKEFEGDPNRLIDSATATSSPEVKRMVHYLIEHFPDSKRLLTERNHSKYDFFFGPDEFANTDGCGNILTQQPPS